MTHTPGPWIAQRNTVHVEDDEEIKAIASCWDYDHEVNKANARFIATAPDMFNALEAVTHLWDTVFEEGRPEGMTQALEALAKAKGE